MPIGRLAVIYDITQKKEKQQAYLQQQWEQAIRIEKERHARDMHDNLGQVLGFINFQAQGIKQELENAGVKIVSDKLDKLIDVAKSTNNDIREYIRNTRNESVKEKNFIPALKQHILNFEKQTGIRVELDIDLAFDWEKLCLNVKFNILNIVKEALNNVRKHAATDMAMVSFVLDREFLCIIIKDHGKGFNVNQNTNGQKSKYGLSIMRERAAEIGAHILIESEIGKGSKIALYLPIKEVRKNAEESNDC